MLYINSYGGSVHAGTRIIEYIRSLQAQHIRVVCVAQNFMNMAFIIMQSCDYRYILSNSIGMQHQMRFSLCGEIENMRNYFNLNDQINNALIDLEIRRIGIDRATYDKKIISDWWIYGHNNIHENTADEIVTISCAPDVSQCPLFLRPDD